MVPHGEFYVKRVRVYYAGIPSKNNKAEKRDVLTLFHKGVSDADSKEIEGPNWEPAELAVIQGWVHANSGTAPHLAFRRRVINEQKRIKQHTLAIDSNLFLYRDTKNPLHYLRFSLNDVFPTTGNYLKDNIDPNRWEQIKRDYNMDLQPWRTKGKHILICLQRNGGWSMKGNDVVAWCNSTIKRLRSYSDRPIVVRAHPGDKSALRYLPSIAKGVKISNAPIMHDFQNAWATVTYNSSPGVASAIEGIPVFVTDPNPKDSQAYDVCNTDLQFIERPNMPDREKWIQEISMCHFNFRDLAQGKAWKVIKDYI